MSKYLWVKLKELFPTFAENVVSFKETDRKSIECKCKDGSIIIFKYEGPKDITLQLTRKRRQK